jgi:hypothetical protein
MSVFIRGGKACIPLLVWAAASLSAQTFTTLHNFTGPDGSGPNASLSLAGANCRTVHSFRTALLAGSMAHTFAPSQALRREVD